VFLVNLVSQRFPSTERREQIPIPDNLIKEVLPQGDFHLQEERRLFYVGMTRAQEKLYLTAADYYGEGKREKKLSPFIFEALGDKATGSERSEDKSEQLSFLDYQAPEFNQLLTTTNLQPIHIDYISYSQIEAFKTCPLHYRLKYILKIPTPQTASQSFGSSIHAALKTFYDRVDGGEKPGEKMIIACLRDTWVKDGFSSKKHESDFFEKGITYLTGFLRSGYDAKYKPEFLEQKFILHLPTRSGEKPLKIGGIMDRIDVRGSKLIEIVDYKTGATIPSQKEVDNNLQLTFYALAATILLEHPFNRKPVDVMLSLYFLDQQEKISTKRTEDDLKRAIEEIYAVRRQIETSDFKCSGHMFCKQGCEYSLFCQSEME